MQNRKGDFEQRGERLHRTEEIKIYLSPEKRFGIRWFHFWQKLKKDMLKQCLKLLSLRIWRKYMQLYVNSLLKVGSPGELKCFVPEFLTFNPPGRSGIVKDGELNALSTCRVRHTNYRWMHESNPFLQLPPHQVSQFQMTLTRGNKNQANILI